jgi:peptide/nickel transport system ATP-binding protein
MCDRIAVMYLGKIVEVAPSEELLSRALHPYTRALLSSVPVPDPRYKRQPPDIKGGIPTPLDPPARCRFYERCPLAAEVCGASDHPPLQDRGGGHSAACYRI